MADLDPADGPDREPDGWERLRDDAPHQPAPEESTEQRMGQRTRQGSAISRSADAARRLSANTGRLVARGGTGAFSGARRFTHSGGAGESGLSRLLELHAFNTAGDAAIAVSLAGTLFFTVPTEQAAGQVALFLVLTMLPFAVVAPLIGPFLDRFRRGRRWAIGSTLAIRGFCCWVLAGAVAEESPAFYLAALGCLVASKAYGVTRAAAVPRLLPEEFTLVKANSRISLTGTAAAAISAPIAIGAAAIGAEWSLRYAFMLFVVGTVLAILLPSRVDSSAGEEQVDLAEMGGRGTGISITRHVVDGLRSNAGLRLITGFLTIFMAFTLREPPDSLGWGGNATILMGLVIGAAGAGNTLGVIIGNLTRSRSPHRVVLAVLVLDVTALVVAALFFRWPVAALLGLTVGLCQSLGKLSLDALIQRDVREGVRTSMFARSETLLQLSWVIGGLIGIGLYSADVDVLLAMIAVAALLLAWLTYVIRDAYRTRPA
ncbi:MFS transporter [Aeromicrobium sp. CTD01-1L150]|uniref:MFS transporter n=1 Tax=Aeromicrobium sp. CTD01-1L150 TaxID=3341830 RepID=UPI0035C10774